MSRPYEPKVRCHAHRKSTGEQCRRSAMAGQRVCQVHGGAAIQNKIAARERLANMVEPALIRLHQLISHPQGAVALAAVKDILDRNGFKPVEVVQQDGSTVIQIEYIGRPLNFPSARPAPTPLAPGRPLIEFLGLDDDAADSAAATPPGPG